LLPWPIIKYINQIDIMIGLIISFRVLIIPFPKAILRKFTGNIIT
jgi:hypothetical protein